MASSKKRGISVVDANQEKDSFENDPMRARSRGADAAFVDRDTAASESPDAADHPGEWTRAAPGADSK